MSQEALNRAVRTTRRARSLGPDSRCVRCGCTEVTALVRRKRGGHHVILCYECAQARAVRRTIEGHHLLGKVNDSATIPVPGNAHRALSDLQLDRPAALRDNPDRDPLVWLAQMCEALKEHFIYWVEWLDRIAAWLLALSQRLRAQFGAAWWTLLGLPPFWAEGAVNI
jgi:hypothetical protein